MANAPSLSVVRDPARPKKLGRYELEECLGVEGGHETYRARVRGLAGFDRIFAVKCLRRRSGPSLSRNDPFVLAAKRMSTITEPRVPRVLDADVVDGVAIAVTEFVHGLDLDRFREWAQVSGELATGSEDTAVRWQKLVAYVGTEVAGALAALHALVPPVVHGALSPRNVVATARGGIRLLDVGLAVAAQKSGEPLPQRAVAYAPPPSSDPEPTAAGDVRSLGAMLFELATGELPPADVTMVSARQILEPLWPSMAELIASMLAEEPLNRPRASTVAEVLARHWSDVAEASMVSEMASLVRNFSAFVADAPQGGALSSPTPEPVLQKQAVAATLLSVPSPPPVNPPPKERSSGSFFAVSDERTRVNPDEGYASAMFKALAPEPPAGRAVPPAAKSPAAPSVRATVGGGLGRDLASNAAAPAVAPAAPKPGDKRPAPSMRNAAPPITARTLVMSPAPAVPPLASPPLPRQAVAMPPLPSVAAKPPAAHAQSSAASDMPSSAARTAPPPAPRLAALDLPGVPAPPAPPARSAAKPPSLAPTLPAMPAPSPTPARPPAVAAAKLPPLVPVAPPAAPPLRPSHVVPIPATVAESADWGAQALAALGTQAGIPISLAAGPRTGAGPSPLAPPEPLQPEPIDMPSESDPFAGAPGLAPPDSWMSAQPVSQGARMVAIEAPLDDAVQVADLGTTAPADLLEDEQMENDQTPVFVPLGGEQVVEGSAVEPPLAPAVLTAPGAARGPALEAIAFESGDEPDEPPVELRVAESMAASDELASAGFAADPGLEQAGKLSADQAGEDWQPPPSRRRKILLIVGVSVGLGAGVAALALHLAGDKAPEAIPTLQKPVAKKTAAPALPSGKAAATTAAEKSPAAQKASGVAPAGKTPAAKVPAEAVAVAEKATGKVPPVATAEKPLVAEKAAAKPSLAAPAEQPAIAEKAAAKVLASPAAPATKVAALASPPTAPAKVTAVLPPPAVKTKEAAQVARAPAVPSAGGMVRVRVNSQPDGAMVWINGEERGKTPLVVELAPGSARVVLVRAGHLTDQSTLEVRDGAKLDVTLKPVEPPMSGEARFRAECKTEGKLPIVVNGKETGILCPFSKMRVDPGTHTIGLLLPATGQVHSKEIILFAGVRSVVFQD